ncbi:MAG: 50S ribosomal protein L6 [Candidatus Micrarchaeia archaeon]
MKIELPDKVEAKKEGDIIVIKGRLGSARIKVNEKYLNVGVGAKSIELDGSKSKSISKKAELVETAIASRINSSIEGVEKGIEKKLQVAYVHFPIALEVKGDTLLIKNLFGERIPREAKIVGDTKLEIKGQEIIVKGVDVYDVGQTITNIRKACKAKQKDTRVFQDGIYEAHGE